MADTDFIQAVGAMGLEAAGAGAALPIWELLFPHGPPVFTEPQMNQINAAFKQAFGEAAYQQSVTAYTTVLRLMGAHLQSPRDGQLPNIVAASAFIQDQIHDLGKHTAASMYISAASQYILARTLLFEAAEQEDKASASVNVATACADTLAGLYALEVSYGRATSLENFSQFKQYSMFLDDSLPDDAAQYFGSDYRDKVQKLMCLIEQYDASQRTEITRPKILMKYIPSDQVLHLFWVQESPSTIAFYKCDSRSDGYFPIGDVCSVKFHSKLPVPPESVPYIKAYDPSACRIQAGYAEVYRDSGSGKVDNYSAWNPVAPHGYSPLAAVSGSGDANFGGYKPPANNVLTVVQSACEAVELGRAVWIKKGSQDCVVYKHPAYGGGGIYCIYRSNSRPDNDRVNAIRVEALAGHPPLSRNFTVAFRANTGQLWTTGSNGTSNFPHKIMDGTNPAISSGTIAFQDTAGTLCIWRPGSGQGTKLGKMAAATSPALAWRFVAYQGSNGNLWWSQLGPDPSLNPFVRPPPPARQIDAGLGMMAGTSPSATVSNGVLEAAFQANTGQLWTYNSAAGPTNCGLGMMHGTNPSIATLQDGSRMLAFHGANGNLWTVGTAAAPRDTALGMAAGTSPSIAGLVGGGYQIAFQSGSGNLWVIGTLAGNAPADTGFGMMAGSSPAISATSSGLYVVAFQANTGDLFTYTPGIGATDLALGMFDGRSSPAISPA
jgi:hypothetical protein